MDKTPYVVCITHGNLKPKVFNVNGSTDPFYRYKMRQLLVQVVGKGKMIKTVLLNLDEVATDLNKIPSEYLAAYVGYELGAQSKYNPKKPERERSHLSGEYTSGDLEGVLKKFINEIILCPQCGVPESVISPDKRKTKLVLSCTACGAVTQISPNEKFVSYVLKHPIEMKTTMTDQVAKKKREQEEHAKQMESVSGSGEGEEASSSTTATTTTTTTTEEEEEDQLKKLEAQIEAEQKAYEEGKGKDQETHVVFDSGVSEEDVKKRMETLPEAFRNLVSINEEEEEEEEKAGKSFDGEDEESPVELFRTFVNEKKRTKEEIFAEIQRLEKKFKISGRKTLRVIFEGIFDSGSTFMTKLQEPSTRFLLSKYCSNEAAQKTLLRCIDRYITKSAPSLLDKIVQILNHLYDKEILEEEVIIAWYEEAKQSKRKKDLCAKLAKFVDWLKTAEEESDEESD